MLCKEWVNTLGWVEAAKGKNVYHNSKGLIYRRTQLHYWS